MNPISIAVACLVTTPGLTPPPFSPQDANESNVDLQRKAEAIYKGCIQLMRFSLRGARKMTSRVHLNPLWAVAETNTLESPFWSDLPVVPQGSDLRALFADLRTMNEAVIFVTPHSPMLRPSLLVEAAEKLASGTSDVVGRSKTEKVYLWGSRNLSSSGRSEKRDDGVVTTLDQLIPASLKGDLPQIFLFERAGDLSNISNLLTTADGEWARALQEQLGPFA